MRALAAYVRTGGFPFFATAHDEEALDFLDNELNQPFFKIGSGEAHNYEFLRDVARRGKPVIISFGLQSDMEIVRAIDTLREAGATEIIALHCTTEYPTPYEHIDLSRMQHLKRLLQVPVGISDHSAGWHVVLAAVGLGACVVEKHLTFGKNDPRSLDNAGALLPEEFRHMVSQIRDVEKARCPIPEALRLESLRTSRDWAGQSIVAARDLFEGEKLSRALFRFKRPSRGGLPAGAVESILGKKIKRHIPADEQILWEDVER